MSPTLMVERLPPVVSRLCAGRVARQAREAGGTSYCRPLNDETKASVLWNAGESRKARLETVLHANWLCDDAARAARFRFSERRGCVDARIGFARCSQSEQWRDHDCGSSGDLLSPKRSRRLLQPRRGSAGSTCAYAPGRGAIATKGIGCLDEQCAPQRSSFRLGLCV